MATWEDGWEHHVEDLSAAELEEIQRVRSSGKARRALWSAPWQGQELRVLTASDRNPIAILKYGKAQVCQLRIDAFEDKLMAVDVMLSIMKSILSEKVSAVDKKGIYELRDALVKEHCTNVVNSCALHRE